MTDMELYLNSLDQKMLEHVRLACALVTELEATELDSDRELAALSTGDPPTDLYEVFSALEVTGLDTVIGFSWPSTDSPERNGSEGGDGM